MAKSQSAVREDAGTARIVHRARTALAAGSEILLPKPVADRLATGENAIRLLREWREDTQSKLALRVGITQGYLSELEAGRRKGPFALHQKIARALNVPIDLLLPIAVSDEEADSPRFAKRRQDIADMKRRRRPR